MSEYVSTFRGTARTPRKVSFVPVSVLVAALVLLLSVALFAPGAWWLWFSLAGAAVLVVALVNRGMAQLVLGMLANVSPPISAALEYNRRQLEYGQLVRDMNGVLVDYKLKGLEVGRLDAVASRPPYDARDDLAVCCNTFSDELFAASQQGPQRRRDRWRWLKFWRASERPERQGEGTPEILEVLYRDAFGLPTTVVWKRLSEAQRNELAVILVDSDRLPPLQDGRLRIELVRHILDRLPGGFSCRQVIDELSALQRLWKQVYRLAEHLRSEGIPATADLDTLLSEVDSHLAGGLFQDVSTGVSEEILVLRGERWLHPWVEAERQRDPQADRPSPDDVRHLVLVALGSFGAQVSVMEPEVLGRLAVRLAVRPEALKMLLAYLWKRSKAETDADGRPDLSRLAKEWVEWSAAVVDEMGSQLAKQMRDVLAADLRRRIFPTWLPVYQAMGDLVQQTRGILALLRQLKEGVDQGGVERQKLEEIAKWTGTPAEELLSKAGADLIAAAEKAVEEKMRQMLPAAAGGETPQPEGRLDAEELQRGYDRIAAQFKPETRLLGYLGSYSAVFDTLALFRARADELAEQLDELGQILLAETAGGSAYVITFGQNRGELADVIDELQADYGFCNYTRYSRIGLLPSGESFEELYRRFEADLEERLARKVAGAAAGEWEQVEITVQQISLLHRHDFALDAKPSLKPRLAPATYSAIFKVPPSIQKILGPAGGAEPVTSRATGVS